MQLVKEFATELPIRLHFATCIHLRERRPLSSASGLKPTARLRVSHCWCCTPARDRRGHTTLSRVANYLRSRLRATDELGWLDDEALCVVLSATLPTGAWKIAEAIRSDWSAEEMPEFTVYYYPSDNQTPRDPEGEARQATPEHIVRCEPVRAESMEPLFAKPIHGWKRCLDIAGATSALLLLSPILVSAAIAIRLTSPAPYFLVNCEAGAAAFHSAC